MRLLRNKRIREGSWKTAPFFKFISREDGQKMEKKRKRILLSLSIPAFLLIVIFMIVPLGNALRVSFFKWNGYSQKMKFIGLKNYRSLFSDKVFWRSTVNTFIYGFGSTRCRTLWGCQQPFL